jgi:hypothetical protein
MMDTMEGRVSMSPFVSKEQQAAICSRKDAKSKKACKEFASKTDFTKLPKRAKKKGA